MIQIGFKKTAIKLIMYVKENWGAPFVAGFMVLLLGAAVSLSIDSASSDIVSFANNLALWSYYALVVGVFLEFASFLKYRGKSNSEVPD